MICVLKCAVPCCAMASFVALDMCCCEDAGVAESELDAAQGSSPSIRACLPSDDLFRAALVSADSSADPLVSINRRLQWLLFNTVWQPYCPMSALLPGITACKMHRYYLT